MSNPEVTKHQLHALLNSQKFAVLSTSHEHQPYASLVAFAATDDLRDLLFATSRHTRKFANLTANSQVALLIDSRSNQDTDVHEAIAATAAGSAAEVSDAVRSPLLAVYLTKHPQLADFVQSPECALIRVSVACYYVVSQFQQVAVFHIT
jgi:hypothetical protein